MGARPLLGFLSLVLLAGGVLLQFFVILAGTSNTKPLNLVYFLQTTTTGINGARDPSRWTPFYICGVDSSGHNANCGKPVPALPFNPPGKSNFDTDIGVPAAFIGTHKYFYLSRFAFAFLLISMFFSVIALFTGLLALCTRLGAYMSSLNTFLAAGFQVLFAALMTAWSVMGRDHFNADGQTAKLGRYGYGFTWASVACFFISTVLFCIGGSTGRGRDYEAGRSRGGLFGRKRSTRSRHSQRGSFLGSERSGIKDDYS
ncbi:hypothetical protein, variant [Verruconis gallopava]|uniref:MARVEL domain-containing protein n=1 Tax=Verruconis gallopava TaxID=253628 RepID=A0A0D2AMB7_9PEZI|nr:uncharacterized protein PV09_01804 [Verruconis gallopava]XP_016217762.1 hypothetical protein, variant [Verruconis gallopava]KIW07892.1 hypothetical protein PV09_01804 [Verruconis gallopava]KIW07893.1 hypothetical protein, variant [Verruconis gallopava]